MLFRFYVLSIQYYSTCLILFFLNSKAVIQWKRNNTDTPIAPIYYLSVIASVRAHGVILAHTGA